MASVGASLKTSAFGQTHRPDAWWSTPLLAFLGLSAFVIYSTWAAFQGAHYYYGPYLSPFYSPEIFGDSPHALIPGKPGWWPGWMIWSPALLILWAPAGFRFTCYYYRGTYYKSFWADPPACAVGEPRKSYLGEHSFPLIFQNIHRYFSYLAALFILLLAHDAWKALWFEEQGTTKFGLGVGTIVLTLNVVFLGGYTFGCHSIRHLIGGFRNTFSSSPTQHKVYGCVSCLNRRHMLWAWMSLFWVGFTDLYVRLCSMGIWSDWRIL